MPLLDVMPVDEVRLARVDALCRFAGRRQQMALLMLLPLLPCHDFRHIAIITPLLTDMMPHARC